MTPVSSIDDATYIGTQQLVEMISRALLSIDTLDAFIARADRAMALGPLLHPSEFQRGAEKLHQVLDCARALRDARARIERAARHDVERAERFNRELGEALFGEDRVLCECGSSYNGRLCDRCPFCQLPRA